MIRARTVLVTMSLLPLLALGACSGDDAVPKVAPSSGGTEPAARTTTSPGDPVEPTMPPEARRTDAAGAEAFVKYYWAMVNYAQATGDTSGLERLASKDCSPCKTGISSIKAVLAHGGHIRGGRGAVRRPHAYYVGSGDDRRMLVQFQVDSTRQVVDFPGTSRDRVFPSGRLSLEFLLSRGAGKWLVKYWGKR